MKRVAVMFDSLGPYHCARLTAAQEKLEVLGLELCGVSRIYDWEKIEQPLPFRRATLFPDRTSQGLGRAEMVPVFRAILQDFQPHAVAVPGWAHLPSLVLLSVCRDLRIPVIVMSESTAWDHPRSWHRELVKRRTIKMFSSGLVGGAPHRDYLASLGMPPHAIFLGYDAVDNDYFAREAARIRNAPATGDLPENFFLASARFIAKKNLPALLQAYARYRARARQTAPDAVPWDLVLLGDGPLRRGLEDQIAALGLGENVHLPGFVQYDELPRYYARARAFVHASTTEPWGLVVNEAMASGLPVLVSNRCGCAAELVQEGRNGFSFAFDNVDQLAGLLYQIATITVEERKAMAAESSRIVTVWGPKRFAMGLVEAVEQAPRTGPPPLGSISRVLLRGLICRSERSPFSAGSPGKTEGSLKACAGFTNRWRSGQTWTSPSSA